MRRSIQREVFRLACSVLGCAALSCSEPRELGPGGPAAASSSTTGTGGSAGGGGDGASGGRDPSGGGGTAGGTAGHGGETACAPGTVQPCYDGPQGTQDVGACKAGTSTCAPDGSAWGPCAGQVMPVDESCAVAGDEDCDGLVDEEGAGCDSCAPNEVAPCYSGPAGSEGVGICAAGAKTCNATGTAWGACLGEVLPVAEDCSTPLDEDCDGFVAPCASGVHVWSKSIPWSASGAALLAPISGVAADASGNWVVAGAFYAPLDFGGGPLPNAGEMDVFVVKLTPSGDHVWSKGFGSPATSDGLPALAVCPSGEVVLTAPELTQPIDFGGGLVPSGPGFTVLLDAQGDLSWSKGVGGVSAACTAAGDVVVAATATTSLDFGAGPVSALGQSSAFVARWAADGTLVHAAAFGSMAKAAQIAARANGNALVTGTFSGSIDFGNGPFTTPSGVGAFVADLDAAGAFVAAIGLDGNYTGPRVADHAAGALLTSAFLPPIAFGGTTLTTPGDDNVMAGAFGPGLSPSWAKSFGDGWSQGCDDSLRCGTIAADDFGQIVLSQRFFGQVDFGGGPLTWPGGIASTFVAKLDPTGDHVWSKAFHVDYALTAVGPGGPVLLAGRSLETIDFGGGPLPAGLVLVELAP